MSVVLYQITLKTGKTIGLACTNLQLEIHMTRGKIKNVDTFLELRQFKVKLLKKKDPTLNKKIMDLNKLFVKKFTFMILSTGDLFPGYCN